MLNNKILLDIYLFDNIIGISVIAFINNINIRLESLLDENTSDIALLVWSQIF